MNYKKLGKILGKIMIMEGLLMMAPLAVAFIYDEPFLNILAFIIPIVALVGIGFMLQLQLRLSSSPSPVCTCLQYPRLPELGILLLCEHSVLLCISWTQSLPSWSCGFNLQFIQMAEKF